MAVTRIVRATACACTLWMEKAAIASEATALSVRVELNFINVFRLRQVKFCRDSTGRLPVVNFLCPRICKKSDHPIERHYETTWRHHVHEINRCASSFSLLPKKRSRDSLLHF